MNEANAFNSLSADKIIIGTVLTANREISALCCNSD